MKQFKVTIKKINEVFLNIIISILILNCSSNVEPKIQILTGVKGNKSFEKF